MRRKALKYCIVLLPLLAVLSCRKDDANAVRGDEIYVYDTRDDAEALPLERTWISVRGGTNTYYVRSSRPFEIKWQDSGDGWGRVGTPEKLDGDWWKISVTADPISSRTPLQGEGLYQRRYGVVMLTSSSHYLGTYLKVEQGMEQRLFSDFSWLSGSPEPNATHKDLLMSRWTTAQQNMGYTSTVLPGQEEAWVYSKEGYVKIGSDKAIGADLITPRVSAFLNDTLLVVSFRAVVQNGALEPDFSGGTEPIVPMRRIRPKAEEGEVDLNRLTLRITGGGQFRDAGGVSSLTFDDIPTYDLSSPDYPADIFRSDEARYIAFIEGTEQNPVTVNTQIHFEAGDQSGQPMERCNRIFLDDLCIYRFSDLFDEDIFPLIGRSGKDSVL